MLAQPYNDIGAPSSQPMSWVQADGSWSMDAGGHSPRYWEPLQSGPIRFTTDLRAERRQRERHRREHIDRVLLQLHIDVVGADHASALVRHALRHVRVEHLRVAVGVEEDLERLVEPVGHFALLRHRREVLRGEADDVEEDLRLVRVRDPRVLKFAFERQIYLGFIFVFRKKCDNFPKSE